MVAHIGKMPDREIAEHLGVPVLSVAWIRRSRGVAPVVRPRLTKDQIEFIREHYRKDMTPQELADKVGKPLCTIYKVADRLNIMKRH